MKFTYFLREIWKKIQKKIEKFLKNGFLVLSEQSRTKLRLLQNQNQTITKCFSKFGTKPDPNRTEPKRTEISRNFNWYLWFDFGLISICSSKIISLLFFLGRTLWASFITKLFSITMMFCKRIAQINNKWYEFELNS